MRSFSEEDRQQVVRGIRPIATREAPSEVLAEHFPRDCRGLPITGGWGYTREDAFVFLREPEGRAYDYVSIEYMLVKKRTYEELIIFRAPGEQFSGIEFATREQSVVEHDNRWYDRLKVEVCAWSDRDWEALKAEWEHADHGQRPGFDVDNHLERSEAAKVTLEREFWFDISHMRDFS